jgi:hypothetical protein
MLAKDGASSAAYLPFTFTTSGAARSLRLKRTPTSGRGGALHLRHPDLLSLCPLGSSPEGRAEGRAYGGELVSRSTYTSRGRVGPFRRCSVVKVGILPSVRWSASLPYLHLYLFLSSPSRRSFPGGERERSTSCCGALS